MVNNPPDWLGTGSEPRSATKPICYGLVNSEGKMHWSESCIFPTEGDATEELEYLQRHDPDDGWRVAPFYVALPSHVASSDDVDAESLARDGERWDSALGTRYWSHAKRQWVSEAPQRGETVRHPTDAQSLASAPSSTRALNDVNAEAVSILTQRAGGELFIPNGPDIKIGTTYAKVEEDGVRFMFRPLEAQ